MLLKIILLAVTLIVSAFASPLPAKSKSKGEKTKVSPVDSCWRNDSLAGAGARWILYANKSSMPPSEKCGQAYLDNMRGRCGVITTWKCDFVDKNGKRVEKKEKKENEKKIVAAKMTFFTHAFCNPDDALAAMGAASARKHKPSKCDEPPDWMLPPK
ncbi:hypothetical protein AJ79_06768 [Helicocarpus griseus UAMH5409]|uniref:Uncharacterized protein n=1 Tax=Helicocarpus griseus UAMH5409 TaxID=1447875 RepID=A0A2B7XA08_9EURO|nr:hypothetical protein AJ79_06768 [Helicocarpus griseus UAMH5409]